MNDTHHFQAGDTLVNTWGYDQTNHDFYIITRTTPKSVWIAPLEALEMREINRMASKVRPTLKRRTYPIYDHANRDENNRPTVIAHELIPERRKTPQFSTYDNTWCITVDHGYARLIEPFAELTQTTYA